MITRVFSKKFFWIPQEIWRVTNKIITDSNSYGNKISDKNKVIFITIPKDFNDRITNSQNDCCLILLDLLVFKFLQFNDFYTDSPIINFLSIPLESKISFLLNKIQTSGDYLYFIVNFEEESFVDKTVLLEGLKKISMRLTREPQISISFFLSKTYFDYNELKFGTQMKTFTREEIFDLSFSETNFISNEFILDISNIHLRRIQYRYELKEKIKQTKNYLSHNKKKKKVLTFKQKLKKKKEKEKCKKL
jgi:hypothetical protein